MQDRIGGGIPYRIAIDCKMFHSAAVKYAMLFAFERLERDGNQLLCIPVQEVRQMHFKIFTSGIQLDDIVLSFAIRAIDELQRIG